MAAGLSPEDIAQLYDRYAPSVYRRAFAVVGRDADAWDLVQEVFLKVLQARQGFRREAAPSTYLYRATIHASVSALRKRTHRDVAPDSGGHVDPAALDTVEQADCRDLLRKLAAVLDERSLAIAAMHHLDAMIQDDIAEVLGLSRKTVNRALMRIRQLSHELSAPPKEP